MTNKTFYEKLYQKVGCVNQTFLERFGENSGCGYS